MFLIWNSASPALSKVAACAVLSGWLFEPCEDELLLCLLEDDFPLWECWTELDSFPANAPRFPNSAITKNISMKRIVFTLWTCSAKTNYRSSLVFYTSTTKLRTRVTCLLRPVISHKRNFQGSVPEIMTSSNSCNLYLLHARKYRPAYCRNRREIELFAVVFEYKKVQKSWRVWCSLY